jgi:hypothetical protein
MPDAAIEKSSRWFCDAYRGSAEALIEANLLTREQLKPQKGRRPGYTVFLADGSPCPSTRRAWREPGYKTIFAVDDGTYIVEVTVSREVQKWRRRVNEAAEHEAEQVRINKELEESGQKYRDWKLQHGYSGLPGIASSYGYTGEWWEGTKEQLQAVGLGRDMKFPGEPGAPDEVHCRCPLGFDVRIYQSKCPRAKSAAGIYTAQSPYLPRVEEPKQFIQYAPGVMREVWQPGGWRSRDFYHGTDTALVAAGLVSSVDLFPGQPGRSKAQASYQIDRNPATNTPHRKVRLTIRRCGKGNKFVVEVPVTEAEEKRRDEVCAQQKQEQDARKRELALERQKLRELCSGSTEDEFRVKRGEELERWMQQLWCAVFHRPDGILSFEMSEGSEEWNDLAGAFQTLRDLVEEAPVVRDKKAEAEMKQRQRLAAARSDAGLQSLLASAKHLRLVYSSPNNERG